MTRDHARINLAIWSDPEFIALPPAAQHLYMTLWTSPDLTYCGTHDWRPGRLAAKSRGWTGQHIRTVADCLIARHFLVVDDDTEEVLIRSWARFDGLLKQPRMAVSYANAYAAVASQTLRAALVHELAKYRKQHPDLACWGDERVSRLLSYPSVSAKELPAPEDPFGQDLDSALGSGLALGLGQTQPKVCPPVSTPSTPAPAPATETPTTESVAAKPRTNSRASRKTALPDDFEPNEANRKIAAEKGIDLRAAFEAFRDHHEANGNRFVDWHKAFSGWLRRERVNPASVTAPRRLHVDQLETPPDGLSDDEYAEWLERRRA